MSKLVKLENTALSPDQLQTIMKNASGAKTKIIMLDDVKETDNIDDLLDPKYNDAIIYSPVMSKYNGHFQCMFKNNDTIYWFDSYGHSPVYLFKFVKQEYGLEDDPALYKILANSKYKLMMNTEEYQGPDAADCGRFSTSVLFLRRQKDSNQFNFNKYYDAMLKYKNLIEAKNFDEAVTVLTQKYLKK